MPSIVIGVLEIDYTVAYPAVSFDLSVVVPDNIPEVGGKKYSLGGTSVSLASRTIRFPISEGPLSGFVELALNPARTEFTVGGEVDLDVKVYSNSWQIGPARVQYMTPLILPEPDWSTNGLKIPLEALQAAVNNAPDDRISSDSGATNLRNDSETQGLIQGILTFAGASDLIDRMIVSAKYIGETIAAASAQPASVGVAAAGPAHSGAAARGPAQTPPASSDVLIALGLGATAGLIAGVSASRGVYFTSGGDYGAYGGYAVEVGIIAELSGGLTFHVYWPDSGKSAKENFNGFNGFVAADVGIESLSGGLALYWPKNDFFSPSPSPAPCGVGVFAGYGVGLPINFYVGNSRTFLGVVPPPKLGPHKGGPGGQ